MSWELQNNLDSKKEIREVYGNTLESMIKEGKDIMVCDSDLVGSSGAGKIFETYKENSVNFGICEQNMIAAAASMSVMGYKPFIRFLRSFPEESWIKYTSVQDFRKMICISMLQNRVSGHSTTVLRILRSRTLPL